MLLPIMRLSHSYRLVSHLCGNCRFYPPTHIWDAWSNKKDWRCIIIVAVSSSNSITIFENTGLRLDIFTQAYRDVCCSCVALGLFYLASTVIIRISILDKIWPIAFKF